MYGIFRVCVYFTSENEEDSTSGSCPNLNFGSSDWNCCSGGQAGMICCAVPLVAAIVIGILVGLFFVYNDLVKASKDRIRILDNFSQADITRMVDQSTRPDV